MLLNYNYLNDSIAVNPYTTKFTFLFVSLISPNFIKNFTTFFNFNPRMKKIQVKQSYILLTWFYHLSMFEQNLQTKEKKLRFFVLPTRKKISTHLKAPIAHKNWSKEQFSFQFYLIRISFKAATVDNVKPSSIDAGLLFVLLSKKHFPILETNLLFLKNYKFFFLLFDSTYFNYSHFSTSLVF